MLSVRDESPSLHVKALFKLVENKPRTVIAF
jgi:hypothetical protein